jgi:hypothetical protein
MVVTSSRASLVLLLLVVLVLTACGRGTPRVVAEDGRGGDAPSGSIWIPETRNVDPGPDPRSARDEAAEPSPNGARAPREPQAPRATSTSTSSSTSEPPSATSREKDAGSGTRDEEPRSRRSSATARADEGGEPADGSGGRDAERPRQTSEPSEPEQARPAEPSDPEPSGDCGAARDEHEPARSEVERAADALAEEVARRWPDTHGGVWVTDGARPKVHAAFTERVGSNLADLCGSFEYPHLLRGVEVELSARELGKLRQGVLDERQALRDGRAPEDLPEVIRATEGRYLVQVDLPRNAVLIVLEEPTPELLDAFRDRYTHRLHTARGPVEEDHDEEAPRQEDRSR